MNHEANLHACFLDLPGFISRSTVSGSAVTRAGYVTAHPGRADRLAVVARAEPRWHRRLGAGPAFEMERIRKCRLEKPCPRTWAWLAHGGWQPGLPGDRRSGARDSIGAVLRPTDRQTALADRGPSRRF